MAQDESVELIKAVWSDIFIDIETARADLDNAPPAVPGQAATVPAPGAPGAAVAGAAPADIDAAMADSTAPSEEDIDMKAEQ